MPRYTGLVDIRMKLSDYLAGDELNGDLRSRTLAMASAPVEIINGQGRKESVTAFEARLIELGSRRCRRRLYCQDFIWLIMTAARMSSAQFNAGIDGAIASRIENRDR